jgi:pleiotropic regulator 1
MAINPDGVLVTGGDDGTMRMWDWASGYNFQQHVSQPQPGSIAAENGIFALAFDRSGTRLLSG